MRKGDEADAKQRYSFTKILGKIKKCGEEPKEASEELPFPGICEEEQGGACVTQADGRDHGLGSPGRGDKCLWEA